MSNQLTDTEEIVQMIRSLDRKVSGLLQDKKDGEDISFERDDIKEQYEEVNDEYKEALKQMSGADKETFKIEYGALMTKIKQTITKL